MPVINITMGKITTNQKQQIIKEVTQTVIEITNIPEHAFACVITELPDENLGLGTKTVAEIKKHV